MVTKKLFNLLTTVFLLGCLAWVATSCSDDDDKGGWAQAPYRVLLLTTMTHRLRAWP